MKIKHAILTAVISIPLMTSMALAEGYDKNKAAGDQAGQTNQSERFDKLDANGDGYLTEDELNIHGSTAAGQSGGGEDSMKSKKMMQDRDENQDGLISQEEFEGKTDTEVGE